MLKKVFVSLLLVLTVSWAAMALVGQAIPPSETGKRGMESWYGNTNYGCEKWIYAYATAELTAKTPYYLAYDSSYMPKVISVSDDTNMHRVVVAPNTHTAGTWGWVQYGGRVNALIVPSATYTAARAIQINNALVSQEGVGYTGADTQFGMVIIGGTTVTTIDAYLLGREAKGST